MSENELLEENRMLKERVKILEDLVGKKMSGSLGAYSTIRAMIVEKVGKEFDLTQYPEGFIRKNKRRIVERRIMDDLKWDLRVRKIEDFKLEHIENAKEYINNYILPKTV